MSSREILPADLLINSDEALLTKPPENKKALVSYLTQFLQSHRWPQLVAELSDFLDLSSAELTQCLKELKADEGFIKTDEEFLAEKEIISRALRTITPSQFEWLKTQSACSHNSLKAYLHEAGWSIGWRDQYMGLNSRYLINYLSIRQPNILPNQIGQKLQVQRSTIYKCLRANPNPTPLIRHTKAFKRRQKHLEFIAQKPDITPTALVESQTAQRPSVGFDDLVILYITSPGRQHLIDPNTLNRIVSPVVKQALDLEKRLENLLQNGRCDYLMGLSISGLAKVLKCSVSEIRQFALQIRPNKLADLQTKEKTYIYPYMYETGIFLDFRSTQSLQRRLDIKKQLLLNPQINLPILVHQFNCSTRAIYDDFKILRLLESASPLTSLDLSSNSDFLKISQRLDYWLQVDLKNQLLGLSFKTLCKLLETSQKQLNQYLVEFKNQTFDQDIQTVIKIYQSLDEPTTAEVAQLLNLPEADTLIYLRGLNLSTRHPLTVVNKQNQKLLTKIYEQLEYPTLKEIVDRSSLPQRAVKKNLKVLDLPLYHQQDIKKLKTQKLIQATWHNLETPSIQLVAAELGYTTAVVRMHLKEIEETGIIKPVSYKLNKKTPSRSAAPTKTQLGKQKAVYPPLITAKISNGFRQRSAVAKHLRHKYIQIILDHRPEIVASLKTGSYQYIQEIADMLELKPMQINFDLQSMEYLPKTLSFDLERTKK